ncbi:hypothetical protein [Streptomyces triticirhizae]|uniref:Uncharacterized protein n=1 Tax=Streptomyces triticirhizae TaxID=2483353 RepID=A0A3M2LQJ7_9ACTN|nr:hypothetical protein [Streptomyces triticirhizae]RMI39751.1 hypothetical protein EBN88_14265 [Streptomyces triticirhizae]
MPDHQDPTPARPYLPAFEAPYEAAYQQRVNELLAMEEAVLAARAARPLHPHHQPLIILDEHHQPARQADTIPTGAKTYAVVALSTGGSLALGGLGLAVAAPALASLATLAASAAGVVVTIVLALLLVHATSRRDGGGTQVHVHRGARVRVRNLHIR